MKLVHSNEIEFYHKAVKALQEYPEIEIYHNIEMSLVAMRNERNGISLYRTNDSEQDLKDVYTPPASLILDERDTDLLRFSF